MKIKPADYDAMKARIVPFADRIKTHREYLKTDARVKDLETRLAWDLCWSAGLGQFVQKLYAYLNDTHITTALKQIVRELEGGVK